MVTIGAPILTTSPWRAARTETVPANRSVDVGVAEPNRGLILLSHRILEIGLGRGDRALRGIRLMRARNWQLSDPLRRPSPGPVAPALSPAPLADWSRPARAPDRTRYPPSPVAMVRRLSLSVRSSVALACINCAFAEETFASALATSLVVDPEVDCFGVLHLGDFVLQARDGGSGCGSLRLQFRRIEDRDQISRLHRSAFIHQQFLDAAFDLRADDHLVRVDGADQDQSRE